MNYPPVKSKYIENKIRETPLENRRYIDDLVEMRRMLAEGPRNPEEFISRYLHDDHRYLHDFSELEMEIEYERKAEREPYRETAPHELREEPVGKDMVARYYVFKDNYGYETMDGHYVRVQRKNEIKIEEGTYKNGDRDGLWTYYYATGKKWFECNYKDGCKIGQEVTWDKKGEIILTELYKNDLFVRDNKMPA